MPGFKRLPFYLAIFYIVFHFFTLAYQPLPWFDETYFANIAMNFMEKGTLTPTVAVFEEVKIYGFVYFLLTGLSIKLLGLGIWSFRVVNLMMGIGCLWLMLRIFRNISSTNNKNTALFILSLMAFDPFFNLSLHEGRMDLMALFFMLMAYYFVQLSLQKYTPKMIFLIGFFVSLALLTTPRVGIIIPGVFVWILIASQYALWNKIKFILLIITIIFSFYSLWIFYAFGDYFEFIDYYLYPTFKAQNGAMTEMFLGGNLYIPKQEYLLIISVLLMVLIALIKKISVLKDACLIASVLNIFCFYLIVKDYGPYSIFILPFYYLMIFGIFDQLKDFKIGFEIILVFILFTHHLTYFALKNTQTLTSLNQRNYQKIDQFIAEHIPEGSRVVGEPLHYYSVIKSGSDFQYMDLFDTLEFREYKHRTDYQYEYLIVSDHLGWRKPHIVDYYLEKSQLKPIAKYQIHPIVLANKINQLGLISQTERTGYNCTIYKRVQNAKNIPR